MNFREILATRPVNFLSKLGALKFGTGIFKEYDRTPHFEMEKSIDMYSYRPMIQSGINQIVKFIIGNRIKITSSDKRTADFLDKWLDQRKLIKNSITNFITMVMVAGNGYMQPSYRKMTNGIPLLDTVDNVEDPSRVYLNVDARSEDEYWLYRVPTELKTYLYRGSTRSPKFYKVNYVVGSQLFRSQIWAIPIHKKEIWHLPLGWSRDGLYGRGFLASAIDDEDVMREIIKNYAVMARYRALGKKIISLGSDERPSGPDDVDKMKLDFQTLQDEEHLITNIPFKSEPLVYVGENDPMDAQVDFLRRDVSSGLVPNFLTPWNSEVNRATAGEVKIPFQLELDYIEEQVISFLNDHILVMLNKSYPWLADDASFQFGHVDLESKEEKMQYARDMYNENVITLNEYRMAAGYDPVEGGNIWAKDAPKPIEDPNKGGFFNSTGASFATEKKSIGQEVITSNSETPGHSTLHEAIEADVSDETWKRRLTQRKIMKGNNLKVLKKHNIGGKILRMATDDEDSKVYVFNGVQKLNDFNLDEKKAANVFYDITRDKLIKQQEEFIEGNTPVDDEVDKFFDQMQKIYNEATEELFEELEKAKTLRKKEKLQIISNLYNNKPLKEILTIKPRLLGKLDAVFAKFNNKIRKAVDKVTGGLLNQILKPGTQLGDDVDVENNKIKKELESNAELLKQSKTLPQIKTFNDKKVQDIRRILSDGIVSGKSYGAIKQDIKDNVINFKKRGKNPQDYEIERIVRTEMNSNTNL
jgi:hypothetical protein